jgi:phenylalanyl-tRNA synthetase beta chain
MAPDPPHPGLLKAIRRNAYRQVRGTALFEVSSVFRMVDGQAQERPKAAIALTGTVESAWSGRREFDFFDAKGVVEALMADLGITWTLGEPVGGGAFHPGRSGFIEVDGFRSGSSARCTHGWRSRSTSRPVAVAELEVSLLMQHAAKTVEAHDVPRFPPVRRDLAFVLDERIAHASVEAAIREAGGELVATCVLFDVHSGPPLADGKKSLGVLGGLPRSRPHARA